MALTVWVGSTRNLKTVSATYIAELGGKIPPSSPNLLDGRPTRKPTPNLLAAAKPVEIYCLPLSNSSGFSDSWLVHEILANAKIKKKYIAAPQNTSQ